MKFIICISFALLALLAGPVSWAQGTVFIANRDSRAGIDAPIHAPGGIYRNSEPLVLEVMAGRNPANLTPVPVNLWMAENGYWQPQIYTFDHFAPGETAYLQVRAFLAGAGSFDQAVALQRSRGAFDILPIVLGGDTGGGSHPPTLPASLTGLRPLVLSGVPEPSALHLLVLATISIELSRGRRRLESRRLHN